MSCSPSEAEEDILGIQEHIQKKITTSTMQIPEVPGWDVYERMYIKKLPHLTPVSEKITSLTSTSWKDATDPVTLIYSTKGDKQDHEVGFPHLDAMVINLNAPEMGGRLGICDHKINEFMRRWGGFFNDYLDAEAQTLRRSTRTRLSEN